jgi:hypothetical protein
MSQVLVTAKVDTAVPLRLALAGTFDPAAMLARRIDELLTSAKAFSDAHALSEFQAELWTQLRDRLEEAGKNRSPEGTTASLRAASIPIGEILTAFEGDSVATRSLVRLAGVLRSTEDGLTAPAPHIDQAASLFYTIDRAVRAGQLAQGFVQSNVAAGSPIPRRARHPFLDPRQDLIRHFHFGSPLLIEASLTSIETPAGLVGLIYAFVKLSGIDLEVRLHRARLRSQLRTEEANERARRLQSAITRDLPKDSLKDSIAMNASPNEDGAIKETVDNWLSDTDLFPWKLERGEIADAASEPPDQTRGPA